MYKTALNSKAKRPVDRRPSNLSLSEKPAPTVTHGFSDVHG
jgi:hypothetical protein